MHNFGITLGPTVKGGKLQHCKNSLAAIVVVVVVDVLAAALASAVATTAGAALSITGADVLQQTVISRWVANKRRSRVLIIGLVISHIMICPLPATSIDDDPNKQPLPLLLLQQ